MSKLTLLILTFTAILLLSACKADEIESGKVKSETVKVVSTNHDSEGFFTLMPIPITSSNGKTTTTTIQLIPLYQTIDEIKVRYEYEGKKYKLTTDDFKIDKTHKKPYMKIIKKDIGKSKATVVIYENDK